MGGLFSGLGTYGRAFRIMSEYKLWRHTILPGLISVGVGMGLWYAAFEFGDYQADRLDHLLCENRADTWYCQSLDTVTDIIAGAIALVALFFLFRYVVMIVLSPFLSTLSERVEAALTGQQAPQTSAADFVNDIIRGIRIALRNIWRELLFTVIITIVGVVLVVAAPLVPILIFLVQAYYAGFGNIDYTLERKRFNVSQSVRFVRRHRLWAVGNGALFLGFIAIPVVGMFLGPVLGAVAATLSYLNASGEPKHQ